jgi:hypothetical protein
MAEHHLPEIDKLISDFGAEMKAQIENFEDLRAAIEANSDPVAIVDDWEARRLLRQMPEEATAH